MKNPALAPPPMKVDTWRLVFIDIYRHFRPLSNGDDWADMNIFSKIMAIIKVGFEKKFLNYYETCILLLIQLILF